MNFFLVQSLFVLGFCIQIHADTYSIFNPTTKTVNVTLGYRVPSSPAEEVSFEVAPGETKSGTTRGEAWTKILTSFKDQNPPKVFDTVGFLRQGEFRKNLNVKIREWADMPILDDV